VFILMGYSLLRSGVDETLVMFRPTQKLMQYKNTNVVSSNENGCNYVSKEKPIFSFWLKKKLWMQYLRHLEMHFTILFLEIKCKQ